MSIMRRSALDALEVADFRLMVSGPVAGQRLHMDAVPKYYQAMEKAGAPMAAARESLADRSNADCEVWTVLEPQRLTTCSFGRSVKATITPSFGTDFTTISGCTAAVFRGDVRRRLGRGGRLRRLQREGALRDAS